MKKLFVLLSILTLFITGCTVINMSDSNIDEVINKVMKKNSKLKNVNFEGYSYYVPKGITFIDKKDYNALLKDVNNNYYYLYVDTISFYHKVKSKYKVDNSLFYSSSIDNKDKYGYLEISEQKNGYFVEGMYNYAKIESFVKKNNLKDSLNNISMILSSVKYNRKVLATTVGDNVLRYKESNYNIFDTKKDASDFLDYVNEYDNTEKKIDEDKIKIEEGD